MYFLAILVSFAAVYFLQELLFRKLSYKKLNYSVKIEADEVFCGEDVYIFEEIENAKALPVPYVKVNTDTPAGLVFHFTEKRGNRIYDSYDTGIQSVFVMKPYQKINRRWRVNCKKRGVYSFVNSLVITNNLFGLEPESRNLQSTPLPSNTITVLPSPVSLSEHFVTSRYSSGDVITNHSIISDPMSLAGVREYDPSDPQNKINWKATAHTGGLMVNVEDKVTRFLFNIVLNMNSYDIERDSANLLAEEDVERGIVVAASVADRVAKLNMPFRMFFNTPPDTLSENTDTSCVTGEDEHGRQITATRTYCGYYDSLDAMRVLSALKLVLSVPTERLTEHIEKYPRIYANGGNIIFISAFINERLIDFARNMKKQGCNVIFYITTTNKRIAVIPPDVEVYFAA